MPTPESEGFLRQKPKVPPTFECVDFQDNEAVADARDAIIREQWVQKMMKRLVGEEMGMFALFLQVVPGVKWHETGSGADSEAAGHWDEAGKPSGRASLFSGKCYAREGVNHLEKCGKYRDRYLQLLKSTREFGFRGRQQNYIPGVDGPAGGPEVLTNYPSAQEAKGSRGSDTRPGNTTGKGGATLY
ncbi:hypothetical protein A1O7_10066 [Cladophialophora yegresii CBS 114405]|uniref:NADH dehydrogenase n=1 Tax=Cladophialophora yegresii CBS 114405 TaxID=1182544 RepID=W9VNY1_9EURO|nr:uncharacterized protein A1O7_10066 [Cladophialophora yegresii CBS 114405]EXJ54725.1 hypothetical protein A1O7_10066 [Cladophialophora yegresii CBS 114405]